MTEAKVRNIIASTTIADGLDLAIIATTLDCAEYESEPLHGLVHRLNDPKIAKLVFGSVKGRIYKLSED
jgi:transcription initiation factor TFIID TATA-box-binding protein